MPQEIKIWEKQEYLVNNPPPKLEEVINDIIKYGGQITATIPMEYSGMTYSEITKCLIIYKL